MAVDMFRGQIWNQRIFLVKIRENEKNRRTVLITTNPSTHPDYKGFRGFESRYSLVFLKVQFGFSITNKMERLSSGPHWVRSALLFGR